jgi:hypothetical protein
MNSPPATGTVAKNSPPATGTLATGTVATGTVLQLQEQSSSYRNTSYRNSPTATGPLAAETTPFARKNSTSGWLLKGDAVSTRNLMIFSSPFNDEDRKHSEVSATAIPTIQLVLRTCLVLCRTLHQKFVDAAGWKRYGVYCSLHGRGKM